MLRNTFIHIPGVGEPTERRLWSAGVLCWDDFLSACAARRLPMLRRDAARRWVEDSLAHAADIDFFRQLLPARHLWRLWDEFGAQAAYLDIETAGLPPERDYVTVIGVWAEGQLRQYIEGVNLNRFEADIARYPLLVTFNGACFDLPVLRRQFPFLRLEAAHIDLRYLLRRLGVRGGLKKIETIFGLERPPEVRLLTGFDAVLLWRRHLAGRSGALELLLRYNREDCVNLELLMQRAYRMLRESLLPGPLVETCGAALA